MDLISELTWFLNAIADDRRIGPVHISLFVAIVKEWSKNNYKSPLIILPNELMQLSKISGRTTYYKILKELHEYGYIHYNPSHNSFKGSVIYFRGVHYNK